MVAVVKSKYKQNADGEWTNRGSVMVSPVFYGSGWMVRGGFLTLKSGAKCPKRAFRTLRARLGFPITVGTDWQKTHAFFPPEYDRQPAWSVDVTAFAPSSDVEVVQNV